MNLFLRLSIPFICSLLISTFSSASFAALDSQELANNMAKLLCSSRIIKECKATKIPKCEIYLKTATLTCVEQQTPIKGEPVEKSVRRVSGCLLDAWAAKSNAELKSECLKAIETFGKTGS